MRNQIRKLVPDQLVSWIKSQTGAPDMANSLGLLKCKGFTPRFSVDIGAYEGHWSKSVRRIFPDTEILMVEPLPDKREKLKTLAADISASVKHELLSEKSGQVVDFYLGSCGSSIHEPLRFRIGETIQLTSSTLDDLLREGTLRGPDLLKIDVQGAEDRVLRGGETAISQVEVLIIELSIVNSYSRGLLFQDMVKFLADRDLFLYDIAGLLRANRTRSVNEVDGVFVRRSSPLWDMSYFLPEGAPIF